ncbi:MAG TPA: amidase domain-containing protein, partial [Peptostreptococcaceae bacterium]|nr:amidase domain-containing protein [Peptostreptococcaceae bacterium]
MVILVAKKKLLKLISVVVIFSFFVVGVVYGSEYLAIKNTLYELENSEEAFSTKEDYTQYQKMLESIFDYRNKAILEQNEEILKGLYDIEHKYGIWAYEHEVKKMKYLNNWSYKQGVKFKDIKTRVKVRAVKEKEENLYSVVCTVST